MIQSAQSRAEAATPAVAYLRRSTDKQEQSIADQRAEIARYAGEHGYRLVGEYTDDAISGTSAEQRPGGGLARTDRPPPGPESARRSCGSDTAGAWSARAARGAPRSAHRAPWWSWSLGRQGHVRCSLPCAAFLWSRPALTRGTISHMKPTLARQLKAIFGLWTRFLRGRWQAKFGHAAEAHDAQRQDRGDLAPAIVWRHRIGCLD